MFCCSPPNLSCAVLKTLKHLIPLPCPPPKSIASFYWSNSQYHSDLFEQTFVIERLRKKVNGPCPKRLRLHLCVAMRRDEDNRDPRCFGVELRLQVEA